MSGLCPQHPALPGVGVLPDDRAEGHRETGRLAPNLPHLYAERHHRQPGLLHLPAVQSRGSQPLLPEAAGDPCRCLLITTPLSFRWALLAASLGSWPACLWSSSKVGQSWSGRGGHLPNCWPFPPSSFPLACCPGSTTLRTSVASCLGSFSPSPSCPTSGVLVVAGWCFYKAAAPSLLA